MESDGYDKLSDDANKVLDDTTQAVKSNTELQKSITDSMLKQTQQSYADVYEEIQKIIENTGYSVSSSFDEIIEKAKLTSEEVKKVKPSVTASGEGVDDKRPNKSKADKSTENAADASSTGKKATQDHTKADPKANPLTNNKTENNKSNNDAKKKQVQKQLQAWYNSVDTNVSKTKMKEKNHHPFYYYFWKKGKNVGAKDMIKVAQILGYTNLAKRPYREWTKKDRDTVFKKLKGYGFSTGGVIDKVLPMDSNSIYGEYLSRSDDTGMIFARPGESVMTEKFTELLKPSLITMNQFTKLANPQGILPNTETTNQDIVFSPNISVNVDSISSDMDVKTLGNELMDVMYPMITKQMRKDLSRSRGRNK